MPLPAAPDNAARFQLPDWYQKSARETKSKYWNEMIGQSLGEYGDAAYAGRDEEERRGQAQEDMLREADLAATKPTITQQEIDRQFGRKSDAASNNFADALSGLRDYMGESGVGGGVTQGLAFQAELRRLGQLTTARGDAMTFKATSDALDRQRAFDRKITVGNAVNRPISMLGIDFENQALQTRLSQLGIETNRAGAKYAAEASKPGFLDYLNAGAKIAAPLIGAIV